jgi:hypothetical protein
MYVRLRNWVADATAGVRIRADYHDTEDDGFAAGLSQCIARDGQSTIINNLPMNSKRLVALSDPVDPQDASTKAYADTKASLTGGAIFTGNVSIAKDDPLLTLNGTPGHANIVYGDKTAKHRWALVLGNATAEAGSNAGSDFELINYADDGTLIGDVLAGTRSTGLLTVKANPTAVLGVATKQYVDTADALKLSLTGGTVTGNMTVNGSLGVGGELLAKAGYLRFTTTGGAGYIQWNGGANYALGGAGAIWHATNLTPVTNVRLLNYADIGPGNGSMTETPGTVVTGISGTLVGTSGVLAVTSAHARWLQYLTPGGWFTVSIA